MLKTLLTTDAHLYMYIICNVYISALSHRYTGCACASVKLVNNGDQGMGG